MTLEQYLAANKNVTWNQGGEWNKPLEEGKAIYIYDYTPDCWRLSDYVVSSVVSGPAVVLVPRKTT